MMEKDEGVYIQFNNNVQHFEVSKPKRKVECEATSVYGVVLRMPITILKWQNQLTKIC